MANTQSDFTMEQVIPENAKMVTVAGLAWGDEGKGKVAAALEGWYDIVAAANGGGNAGHNVIVHQGTKDERKLHFHELPGASVAGVSTYISGGRVVNITKLSEEIEQLRQNTRTATDIVLSAGAQIILPSLQQKLDADIEGSLSVNGGKSVGTTKKGIGPAYGLRALRLGMNVGQLLYGDEVSLRNTVHTLVQVFSGIDEQNIIDEYVLEREKLTALITAGIIRIDQTNTYISDTLSLDGKKLVVECSQSAMLSLSGNAYPNCTSSECGFNGIAPNLGVEGPGFKVGVIKAIPSKVGNGEFPTRFHDNGVEESIIKSYRDTAGEYGATTGRPRDIGFLDAVQLRYVFKTGNRPDILWINMVDLLSFLSKNGVKNKVAIAYRAQHSHTQEIQTFTDTVPPSHFTTLEVIYQDLPDVVSEDDYKVYVDEVKKVLGFDGPVVIGVGPGSKDNVLFG